MTKLQSEEYPCINHSHIYNTEELFNSSAVHELEQLGTESAGTNRISNAEKGPEGS